MLGVSISISYFHYRQWHNPIKTYPQCVSLHSGYPQGLFRGGVYTFAVPKKDSAVPYAFRMYKVASWSDYVHHVIFGDSNEDWCDLLKKKIPIE